MKIVKDQNPTELIKKTPVQNTPFVVITTEIEGKEVHFVTFGKYKISGNFDTVEHATNYINDMTWDKVVTVASLIYYMLNNENSK